MLKKIILAFMTLPVLTMYGQQASPEESPVIAFASDTQAPMWVETILLRSNNNRTATRLLFSDILQTRPSSLFILGDIVNLGYSERQWKPIDRYLGAIREQGTSVHAILGNHEVMGRPREGEKKFQMRFPNHSRTGYVEITDSVAVVLLNSNFGTLSRAEDAYQVTWYRQTLDRLDADSSVRVIITGIHHSPYTNSKVVSPSGSVQEKFIPHYLNSRKSRLFLSGHCHAFEHFQVGGKDFLVIGGGGGLNQPLKQGIGSLTDMAIDYKPVFHYITIRRLDDMLQVASRHIRSDFTGFDDGISFLVKPSAGAAYAHLSDLAESD